VDSVEATARHAVELLRDPEQADAMGANGREHVRTHFLSTRELEDWLHLLAAVRG
jgi:trehalose synthase